MVIRRAYPPVAIGALMATILGSIASAQDSTSARLGAAFDQRQFHDAILALGSVPLPVLEERMNQFIADGGRNVVAPRP